MMTRSGEPKTRTVTAEEFIQAHGRRLDHVSIYGQELNDPPGGWRR